MDGHGLGRIQQHCVRWSSRVLARSWTDHAGEWLFILVVDIQGAASNNLSTAWAEEGVAAWDESVSDRLCRNGRREVRGRREGRSGRWLGRDGSGSQSCEQRGRVGKSLHFDNGDVTSRLQVGCGMELAALKNAGKRVDGSQIYTGESELLLLM
ncbi:hypothetical protein GQ42DRAFT_7042 [Ramicandelaber brevisporus]|nr:hypothetical protein GQ42DRAFT_7042 [Ramicandelaber brevisporus]